jgi:hypothetical protein
MQHDKLQHGGITTAHRIVGSAVGFAFAGVGVILIVWLWLQPFGFMHPPLLFRLLGSMVSLIFIAVGGSAGVTALRGGVPGTLRRGLHAISGGKPQPGYKCPNCGAGLTGDADVSPSGDVKCAYCRTWFNVHQ